MPDIVGREVGENCKQLAIKSMISLSDSNSMYIFNDRINIFCKQSYTSFELFATLREDLIEDVSECIFVYCLHHRNIVRWNELHVYLSVSIIIVIDS